MKPVSTARSVRIFAPLFAATTLFVAVGCGAGDGNTGAGGGTGSGSTGSGTGGAAPIGSGGGLPIGSGSSGNGTGGDRPVECTIDPVTNMKSCVCISVATWGALGTYGAVPGMDGSDAITSWLNANSTGDAAYFVSKPTITADELAKFDIIIIQDISAWSFTPDEKAAVEAWVRAGGGIISLNGYSANGNEMATVNDLVAFSGLSYVPSSDTVGDNYNTCQYCYGSSAPMGGWVTTHPIAANVKDVGAFHGRSITAGAGSEIVAQTSQGVLGATMKVDSGHVFMFHDEWVTYNSQWTGAGLASNCAYNDPNNMCNNKSPANDYTIPQFWYNALLWAAGNPTCFTIKDDSIIK